MKGREKSGIHMEREERKRKNRRLVARVEGKKGSGSEEEVRGREEGEAQCHSA